MLYRGFVGPDSISYEVVPHVYVLGLFRTGLLTVLPKENGTLVVLKKDGACCSVSLGFEKVTRPKNHWHQIVCSHDFSFG